MAAANRCGTNTNPSPNGPVGKFIQHHFRHFNAATLLEAAREYRRQIDTGNHMMIALAGAMSTAELGLSLAEMIRREKVHLISCTGANLEEDVFNLIAHNSYKRVPHYRELSAKDEENLRKRRFSRVTDTCIPDGKAMRRVERILLQIWRDADRKGERRFPHEFFYQALLEGRMKQYYQIDPKDSWVLAAAEKNLPMVVPGWEDSTIGNVYAAACIRGLIRNVHTVRSGVEYMIWLADHYRAVTKERGFGMLQIGGGIAG
ncbi:MAG: deoxyhypusine synthase family protein, partial [Verrucomicrobiae bacterium]|nr:deoxyhypusine synthase family protein [Verrucomicrobiae bacterium]